MKWSSTLVLALCLQAMEASAGSVRGTVRDAITQAVIEGATVTVHIMGPDSIQVTDDSDAAGQYLLADVQPGNEIYWLICEKAGYVTHYAQLPDPGNSEIVYDIQLAPPPPPPGPGEPPVDTLEVSGRVLAAGSLEAIPNASITLGTRGALYIAHTDGDGRYSMFVPPGGYTVMVAAGGYEPIIGHGVDTGTSGCTYDALLQPENVSVPVTNGDSKLVALYGARPNPFAYGAAIHFALAEPGTVDLRVYDVLGREVKALVSEWMDGGAHAVPIPGDGLPAGTYFCRLVFRAGATVVPMTSLR